MEDNTIQGFLNYTVVCSKSSDYVLGISFHKLSLKLILLCKLKIKFFS